MRIPVKSLALAALAAAALAVAPMAYAGGWNVQQNPDRDGWVVANGGLNNPNTTRLDAGSDKKAADALAKDLNKAQEKGARQDAKDAKKGK